MFAKVSCDNNPDLCNDGLADVFDFIVSLLPVVGTAYDIVKCLMGNTDDCMWILPGLIPGGKLAELGKLGKLGKHLEEMLRAEKAISQNVIAGIRSGGACSFAADTKVLMADGSRKPIKDVKVGDEVQAADPETGERGSREVTAQWAHADDITVELEIDGSTLRTTEDHPFWNATDKQWQRADQLDPGDQLLTADGQNVVVNGVSRVVEHRLDVYNLTVAQLHTYHVVVGSEPVLVHNECITSLLYGKRHLALGVEDEGPYGVKNFAEQIGAAHLMNNGPTTWRDTFQSYLSAMKAPGGEDLKLSFEFSGIDGENPRNALKLARDAVGSGKYAQTQWELVQIADNGLLNRVQFYYQGQPWSRKIYWNEKDA